MRKLSCIFVALMVVTGVTCDVRAADSSGLASTKYVSDYVGVMTKKLLENTDVGDETHPIYIKDGKAVKIDQVEQTKNKITSDDFPGATDGMDVVFSDVWASDTKYPSAAAVMTMMNAAADIITDAVTDLGAPNGAVITDINGQITTGKIKEDMLDDAVKEKIVADVNVVDGINGHITTKVGDYSTINISGKAANADGKGNMGMVKNGSRNADDLEYDVDADPSEQSDVVIKDGIINVVHSEYAGYAFGSKMTNGIRYRPGGGDFGAGIVDIWVE